MDLTNDLPANPPPIHMEAPVRQRASRLFGALANETRLQIIELLIEQEMTVGEIAKRLGILQSGASQHLAILSRSGVLAVERQGTSRIYRVRGPRIPRILETIEDFCQVHNLYGDEDILPDDERASRVTPYERGT